ncbi:MAG TPA: hypothetical protein VGL51_15170 [Solirubrobacteraceae bacterium]
MIQAEVRRLALALAPFGVLKREALKRKAGATEWNEATFDSAIAAAVDAGVIESLPGDVYRQPG